MPAYTKTFLSDEDKHRFGRRLSHYLSDFLFRTKCSQSEAAERLGISANKFSQLKSGAEQGRFITSLDYLKGLANLQGMSVMEFLVYVIGENLESMPQKPYSWQEKIYKALANVSIPMRDRFVEALEKNTASTAKMEMITEICASVANLDEEALEALACIARKLNLNGEQ